MRHLLCPLRLCLFAAATNWAAAAAAQSQLTVPATAVGRDGLGLSHLAGVAGGRRQQFIVGASFLSALQGHGIHSISFRRDGQLATLGSGQANMRVLISQGVLDDAKKATMFFAENLGNSSTIVFQGQVNAPSSPRPATRDSVGFGVNEVITIILPQPYSYAGGTLCVDVAGTPVGNSLRAWPIDVDRENVRGQVTMLGQSCVQLAQTFNRHLSADPASLRAGSTMRVRGFAQLGDTAILMLAAQRLGSGMNLGFLGSPNCELWLLPEVTLWTAVQSTTPGFPAAANALLHIPHDAAFLAAAIHAQWLVAQGASLRTSEGASLQLAPLPANIDASIVLSTPSQGNPWPVAGEVEVGAIPVMQIQYQ